MKMKETTLTSIEKKIVIVQSIERMGEERLLKIVCNELGTGGEERQRENPAARSVPILS